MKDLNIQQLILRFFALLVALTMSTAAKVILAVKLGDRSYELKKRATFNPLVHIDPIGTIIFPLVLMILSPQIGLIFAWAKPTFIRLPLKKSWKRDLVLLTFVTPFFNFLLAFIFAILQHWLVSRQPLGTDLEKMLLPLSQALFGVNTALGFFHLLPFPRSDVWNLLMAMMRPDTAASIQKFSVYIWFGLMFLIFSGIFIGVLNVIAWLISWGASVFLSFFGV